jgi:hypothetical protein
MNGHFSGRDFGRDDVEGYQVRVPCEQIAIQPKWTREQLLLNPHCRFALSTSGFVWPCALPPEDGLALEDPVLGLIRYENLELALCAVDAKECAVLFLRLVGTRSIRSGLINVTAPPGFEVRGFDVTNGWWGASPISAQGRDDREWSELRSIAGRHVNEWNLLDDFAAAHQLATICTERDPREGPFRAVLLAVATLETKRLLAKLDAPGGHGRGDRALS